MTTSELHTKKKEVVKVDQKYNTPGETDQELKKALANSKGRKNPNMSEAEARLKFQNKK